MHFAGCIYVCICIYIWYMHIYIYMHYALWLYQTPSLFFLLLFESPYISPCIVPHSSQPCQDINHLQKSFVRFLGIILGENTNSETFSPIFSLISVVCLFGWDPQIWKKKTCQNQSTNHLNLKKSKTQFILKPSHQKLSSIII